MDYLLSQFPLLSSATPFDAITAPFQFAPAAGGDTIQNDGFVMMVIANASGANRTVNIRARNSREAAGDTGIQMVDIPNGGQRWVGFVPKSRFNEAGALRLTYSNEAGLVIYVVRFPRNPFKYAGRAMASHTES